jgi:hypothetical protein
LGRIRAIDDLRSAVLKFLVSFGVALSGSWLLTILLRLAGFHQPFSHRLLPGG